MATTLTTYVPMQPGNLFGHPINILWIFFFSPFYQLAHKTMGTTN
jgi:hypothetical protein